MRIKYIEFHRPVFRICGMVYDSALDVSTADGLEMVLLGDTVKISLDGKTSYVPIAGNVRVYELLEAPEPPAEQKKRGRPKKA